MADFFSWYFGDLPFRLLPYLAVRFQLMTKRQENREAPRDKTRDNMVIKFGDGGDDEEIVWSINGFTRSGDSFGTRYSRVKEHGLVFVRLTD